MEEDNLTGSDLMTTQWSRHLNAGNESKGKGLVEVVVAEVDVEAVAEPVQTPTEFTSTPSLEL
jgi:hypothetical protein